MTTNVRHSTRRIAGAAVSLLLLSSTAAWSATTSRGGAGTPEPTVVQVAASGVDGAAYDVGAPAIGSEESNHIELAANQVVSNMDECELVDGQSGMRW